MKLNRIHGLSLLLVVALILGTLLAGELRKQTEAQNLPPSWQADVAHAQERYRQDGDPRSLIKLLKALAFQAQGGDDQRGIEGLKAHGNTLLSLARDNAIDLERIDDPDEMRLLLGIIRAAGAR